MAKLGNSFLTDSDLTEFNQVWGKALQTLYPPEPYRRIPATKEELCYAREWQVCPCTGCPKREACKAPCPEYRQYVNK